MAYGDNRIYLDCGAPCDTLISVYNRATGQFERGLPLPSRNGNGSGGATFVPAILACARADFDDDGRLNVFDFLEFQNLFDAGDPLADFDGDGELTLFDFLAFQTAFEAGCE